ncbi:amidohydrolase family protein [Xylophilus sp. GW821-FHT01B05]
MEPLQMNGRIDTAEKSAGGCKERIFPQGSCDTHFHVFGHPHEFPFITERSYTPAPASIADYWASFRPVGVDRCILVQPSVYGRNHELLKLTLKNAVPGSMRGVAVIFEDTPDSEIESLHRLGVRGARCNALFSGGVSVSSLQSIADRIKSLGWHIQLLVDVDWAPDLPKLVAEMGLPVVVDHFGHPSVHKNVGGRGLRNLHSLLEEGRAWVKFSGAYRLSETASAVDPSLIPLAHSLVQANPDRILWGSDWPHPGINAHSTSSSELAGAVFDWLPAGNIQKVMVDNPTQLYWNN